MKKPLNPSGLGDLSAGICLTTLSMSCVVSGVDMWSMLLFSCTSWSRLYCMVGFDVLLILPLYSPRRMAAFSWWSKTSLPSYATKLVMVFNLYLSVAAAWKKLVLSSPNLIHLMVYLFLYEDLYQYLSTKEGEKGIYRMARVREKKARDFNQVKCIKDER